MKPLKFFVYIQIYIMDHDVTNMEVAESNIYVLAGQNENQNLTISVK